MPLIRTQIYLTEDERAALISLASETGKKQSELIREAVDMYIAHFGDARRMAVLDRVAGIWKHRNDLPDFKRLRQEWGRYE